LAGSYFIETMTNEMEQAMIAELERLDAGGGIVNAVADGRIQAELSRQAYERELRIARGEIPKVGVNIFRDEDEAPRPIELHQYRQEEANRQIQRLRQVKASRDQGAATAALDALRAAARTNQNVMPAAIDAVEALATVGEVCAALADVYGRHREPVRF
jgi:methylmalonyl-CoA mutase N-terminal domain/subunit